MYKLREQNSGVQNLTFAMKKKLYFLVREDVRKSVEEKISSKEKQQPSPEKNTPLRNPTCTQEDNIKMGLQRTGCRIRAEGVF
jgi:hypothetical protein